MACMKRLVFMIVCFFVFVAQGFSGDKLINVQGRLSDSQSLPLSGSRAVTFRLYNSTADPVASRVWEDSMSVSFSSGLFNVALGQGANSLDTTPFNKLYYLGIQVSGDANEMKPRQLLGASAYSLGSLGDFNVKGKLGIGSTNPVFPLEVVSDTFPQFVIRHKTVPSYAIMINHRGTFDLYPGDSTSTYKFAIAGNEKVRIDATGRVGIGTTNPETQLQVNGVAQSKVDGFKFYMVPVGTVISYAGTAVPTGWLVCDGTSVSRTVYPDLFAAIGTIWGTGDGSTTFSLPNFERRVAVGSGGSGSSYLGSSIGNYGGEEWHTLTVSEMPSHTHNYETKTTSRDCQNAGGTPRFWGGDPGNMVQSTPAGGGAPHNVMQPSAVVRMLIRY